MLNRLSQLGQVVLSRKGVLQNDELAVKDKEPEKIDEISYIPAVASLLESAEIQISNSTDLEQASLSTSNDKTVDHNTTTQPQPNLEAQIASPSKGNESQPQRISANDLLAPSELIGQSETGSAEIPQQLQEQLETQLKGELDGELSEIKQAVGETGMNILDGATPDAEMQDFMQMMDTTAAAENPSESQEQDNSMFISMMDNIEDAPGTSAQDIADIAKAITENNGDLPEFMGLR